VDAMPDSDEMARIMIEISAGWEWGDPRSEVPQTPPNEVFWHRVKIQMKEITEKAASSTSQVVFRTSPATVRNGHNHPVTPTTPARTGSLVRQTVPETAANG